MSDRAGSNDRGPLSIGGENAGSEPWLQTCAVEARACFLTPFRHPVELALSQWQRVDDVREALHAPVSPQPADTARDRPSHGGRNPAVEAVRQRKPAVARVATEQLVGPLPAHHDLHVIARET